MANKTQPPVQKPISPVMISQHWLLAFGNNLKRKIIMHIKKKNPATGNGRVSLNNKSHSSELDINLHSASNGKIQAARFISKRHRISFPTAKLYCELAGIGGVL